MTDDSAPPNSSDPRVIRWCIPSGQPGAPYQCASFTDAKLTFCGAYYVEGAVYPPPIDVPKHHVCVAAVDRILGIEVAE